MNKREYKKLADYLVKETNWWFYKKAGYESVSDATAVIGISGGKDSAVVAAICAKALGPSSVLGILMPNGVQKDIDDSKKVCQALGIDWRVVDIEAAFRNIMCQICVEGRMGVVKTNLPARLRMATLYTWANAMNGRVIGTGNLSESLVGWTTLWGDSACDFNPIAKLFVDEVIGVGLALGLPEEIVRKPPDDGMSGRTDEENLGFTYAQLRKCVYNCDSVPNDVFVKVKARMQGAAFKRNLLSEIPCVDVCRDVLFGKIDLERTLK